MIGRFAPSPTGRMHLGNIWVALLSDLAVHARSGTQILRIEDLDQSRSTQLFTEQLAEDLIWLGLPTDLGQPPEPMIRQSERTDLYREIFSSWQRQGQVYPCTCKRADLLAASAPHAEDGHRVYAGTCRPQDPGEIKDTTPKAAWRLIVEARSCQFSDLVAGEQSLDLARDWGDFVVRRADGGFAYQFACAVDDALMGINLVLRGRDLLCSTFPQLYIFDLLKRPAPEYAHVPLLIDPAGHRLSKRQQSLDLGALQQAGFTAPQLIGYLACLAGLIDKPEPIQAKELQSGFSLEKIKDRTHLVVHPADLYRLLD